MNLRVVRNNSSFNLQKCIWKVTLMNSKVIHLAAVINKEVVEEELTLKEVAEGMTLFLNYFISNSKLQSYKKSEE